MQKWPAAVLVVVLAASAARAADFPPITAEERAMGSASWDPRAHAVVLSRQGEFWMADKARNRFSASLQVRVRMKILDEAGKDEANVELVHGSNYRLRNLEGRTVLPDGTEVPLGEDSTFRRTLSEREKIYVTTIQFPSVEAGAILDYAYEIRVDSLLFVEPWYFQSRSPTLHSEVIYYLPRDLGVLSWRRQTVNREMQIDNQNTAQGRAVRIWMDELPGIPEEDSSYPFEDLSSRVLMVPTEIVISGQKFLLLEDWRTTCGLVRDYYYEPFEAHSKAAKRKAKELVAGLSGERQRAEAVYRFVRDEIRSRSEYAGVVNATENADLVLENGEGSPSDKSLLLHIMLDAVGVDTDIIWAANRLLGQVDTQVATPGWFERSVLRGRIDGREVYIDPATPTGLDYLAAGSEGMPALVFGNKPEIFAMPALPFDANQRRVFLDLVVDEEGRVTGKGSAALTGHRAVDVLAAEEEEGGIDGYWEEWLENRFPGYETGDITHTERLDELRAEASWTLTLAEEEVLGDEVSLSPSRPLGPVRQRFAAPGTRRSPVLFEYPSRDLVELHVAWPESWKAQAVPADVDYSNRVGALSSRVSVSPGRASYTRQLDILERELGAREAYAELRELFDNLERHDAQELVLLHP